jgi:hypothetical protein
MDQEVEAEPLGGVIPKLDHLPEFPSRVDMEKREGQGRRMKGLERDVQHGARILADRIKHDRRVKLRNHLAHDVNSFRFEAAEMEREMT